MERGQICNQQNLDLDVVFWKSLCVPLTGTVPKPYKGSVKNQHCFEVYKNWTSPKFRCAWKKNVSLNSCIKCKNGSCNHIIFATLLKRYISPDLLRSSSISFQVHKTLWKEPIIESNTMNSSQWSTGCCLTQFGEAPVILDLHTGYINMTTYEIERKRSTSSWKEKHLCFSLRFTYICNIRNTHWFTLVFIMFLDD